MSQLDLKKYVSAYVLAHTAGVDVSLSNQQLGDLLREINRMITLLAATDAVCTIALEYLAGIRGGENAINDQDDDELTKAIVKMAHAQKDINQPPEEDKPHEYNTYIINVHSDNVHVDSLYSVHKLVEKDGVTRAEHCGFIFFKYQDADNYTEKGILPAHYIKIDWDLFPAKEAYVEINQ